MKRIYKTGEFAKLANVTIRTIRYYDKVGLLKPSFVMENGYRQYSDEDFIKLQKIISLKHLGFSLEEIYPLIIDNDSSAFIKSIDLQIDLINKRLAYYQLLKDSLKDCRNLIDNNNFEWDRIVDLVRLSSKDELIIDEFKSANNLNARIKLHELYSTNKQGWFNYLYQQIDFTKVNRLLELGCGNGELWKYLNVSLRNREIYLSDNSEGMIDEVRNRYHDKFSYFVFNAENIPFRKNSFDCIVANHLLFYLNDVDKGISEISRVLRKDGILYASTYGESHMKEINELVKEFDESILLAEDDLFQKFGLENGRERLKPWFKNIQIKKYEDSLVIKDSTLLFEYIVTCYGNQNEVIGNRLNELKKFIDQRIKRDGSINVTKDVGIIIAQKK